MKKVRKDRSSFQGKRSTGSRALNLINKVTTVLILILVLLATLLVGGKLFGYQTYTVLSGSMEPAYPVGSLIYVKSVKLEEVAAGDVITFMVNEETVATHRVVEIVPDEENPEVLRFRTKGDANTAEDGALVHYRNVIGTPILTIPYLGFFAEYIQNTPGRYMAISAGAVLLLLLFLPDLLGEEDKKSKEKKQRDKMHSSG